MRRWRPTLGVTHKILAVGIGGMLVITGTLATLSYRSAQQSIIDSEDAKLSDSVQSFEALVAERADQDTSVRWPAPPSRSRPAS